MEEQMKKDRAKAEYAVVAAQYRYDNGLIFIVALAYFASIAPLIKLAEQESPLIAIGWTVFSLISLYINRRANLFRTEAVKYLENLEDTLYSNADTTTGFYKSRAGLKMTLRAAMNGWDKCSTAFVFAVAHLVGALGGVVCVLCYFLP